MEVVFSLPSDIVTRVILRQTFGMTRKNAGWACNLREVTEALSITNFAKNDNSTGVRSGHINE